MNCEYFQKVNFDTDLSYLEEEFDARLWLRELVISSQTNNPSPPFLLMMIASIILASLPVALDAIFEKIDEEIVE